MLIMILLDFILSLFDRDDVIKKFSNVMPIQQLTKINEVKSIVRTSGSFLRPKKRMIKEYMLLFKLFEETPIFYNEFFNISKVLGVHSANGRTFIIDLKSDNKVENSELIVKIPLGDGDSLSYEYYIGATLNKLREEGLSPIFSLLYGRVMCGVNRIFEQKKSNRIEFVDIPKELLDNGTIKMCDSIFDNNKRMHLIYEYIRNVDTFKNVSFADYIDRLYLVNNKDELYDLERNIINILIIVMYSLQVAYDRLGFTHYDLHPGNIILIESENPVKFIIRYGKQHIEIVSRIIPSIIDYGRCYVTPNQVAPENSGFYIDIEKGKQYSNFGKYQTDLFENFIVNDLSSRRGDVIDMNDMVWDYVQDLKSKEKWSDDQAEQAQVIIMNSILNRNVNKKTLEEQRNIPATRTAQDNYFRSNLNNRLFLKQYDFGIGPKSNEKYDFFRLTKSIIKDLLATQLPNNMSLVYKDMWEELTNQLSVEYPFYDTKYFSLPCDYHMKSYNPNTKWGVWGHWIKHPADVGKILYNAVKSDKERKIRADYDKEVFRYSKRVETVYNIGNGSSYRNNEESESENIFGQIAGRVHKKRVNITKNMMQKTENKLSYGLVNNTKNMKSEFYEYVESDLMKKIKQNRKIFGSPKLRMDEGEYSRMPAPWPKKK